MCRICVFLPLQMNMKEIFRESLKAGKGFPKMHAQRGRGSRSRVWAVYTVEVLGYALSCYLSLELFLYKTGYNKIYKNKNNLGGGGVLHPCFRH